MSQIPSQESKFEETESILNAIDISSGYGKREVLKGISFELKYASITAVIGPNGSGKSTVLKTVFGLIETWGGTVEFRSSSCARQKPSELIRQGMVYVPQGNRVFGDLTVRQNLSVSLRGVTKLGTRQRIDEMAEMFPAVREFMSKSAGKLSGGEKQQVALAMGLIKKPQMLLLDEPSLGLAPNLLKDVFGRLKHINQNQGVTILVVEHKVREVSTIANHMLGLRRGEIVERGAPSSFDEARLKNVFLG